MSKVIGFQAEEEIVFGLPNRNYGGHDRATASRLVREGKGRWAWCHGGVLAFVPLDYELLMYEHFLIETEPNHFEVVR